MTKPVVIVDYGMGNISSLTAALKTVTDAVVEISADADRIHASQRIILPGVGNFKQAMTNLSQLGLVKTLQTAVCERDIPILGICLGMQLLGKSSTESGYTPGLDLYSGTVKKLKSNLVKVPHVGFNQVSDNGTKKKLLNGLKRNPDFYFTHSYRMTSHGSDSIGSTFYGENFTSLIEHDNIYGTQFHPELSQSNGLRLLHNFMTLTC